MCRNATTRVVGLVALFSAAHVSLYAQSATSTALEWRRIGNALMDVSLPGLATGPVRHVWYSPDGRTLFSQTASGGIWETRDFETWKPSALRAVPVRITLQSAATRPEPSARVEQAAGDPNRYYAMGRFVYRSDDGGSGWSNLTAYRNQSILGGGLSDLALSSANPDEITVSSQFGVWRSLDGGATWDGLNQGLPNLPATRLLAAPGGMRPAVVSAPLDSGEALELEWAPGERRAWRAADPAQVRAERRLRQQVSQKLGFTVRAVRSAGDWIYAGSADGRLFVSPDRGQTWLPFNVARGGAVNSIWVNSKDPRIALAALSGAADPSAARIVHTMNGGQFWEDITANLPGAAGGVVADMKSGAIYAATNQGVFHATADLANLVSALNWQRISSGLPAAAALDVLLDENGNQLFVLLEGQGVYATMAPHRLRELSVVNAADFSSRPAAPGTLLSILGRRLERVSSGDLNVPILGSTDAATQVQVPFEAKGSSLSLVLSAAGLAQPVNLPLEPVSPAIFIDRDGSPLLLDADSGVALDAMTPARSGGRIQILATGLGAVDPPWQTGIAAPVDNTPKVVAAVRAFIDREPVEVTRATLAPGYIGFYLIEIQMPKIVNAGPAELYIDAGDKSSNRVRVYLAP